MKLLKLAITQENIEFEVDQCRRQIRSGSDDGRKLLRLCALYRQLGCTRLLGDLDAARFRVELFKSARCYQWLLERPQGSVDPYYLCRSRGNPLFDAMACGANGLAKRIAALMQAPFAPRMEPEEDFRWYEILASLLAGNTAQPDRFAAFDAALEGKGSARRDAAFAIVAKDENGFNEALQAIVAEWANEVKRQKGMPGAPGGPYFADTEAHVCVEGVALARLAAEMGLPRPTRVRFVPDELFRPAPVNFPEGFVP